MSIRDVPWDDTSIRLLDAVRYTTDDDKLVMNVANELGRAYAAMAKSKADFYGERLPALTQLVSSLVVVVYRASGREGL